MKREENEISPLEKAQRLGLVDTRPKKRPDFNGLKEFSEVMRNDKKLTGRVSRYEILRGMQEELYGQN